MNPGNRLKFFAGSLIAVFTVWLTFRNTDWTELSNAFSSARWGYFLLVLPPLAFSYVFRIYRWVVLLSPLKRVSKSTTVSPLLTGFMLNGVLPGRLGEFVRSALLSQKAGIPFVSSFATVVVARLFDGLALTGLTLVVMASMWDSLSKSIRTSLTAAGIGYLILLMVLFSLRKWHTATSKVLVYPFRKFKKLANRLEKILIDFAGGLDVLQNPGEIAVVAALTAAVWLSLCISVIPLFYALNIYWEWQYPALILVLAGFGMLIPTPAGTGTVHYAVGVIFPAIVSGIPEPKAKALAIVFHATQFLPIIIAGLIASKGHLKVENP